MPLAESQHAPKGAAYFASVGSEATRRRRLHTATAFGCVSIAVGLCRQPTLLRGGGRPIDASASHAIAELVCLVCGLDQTGDGVAADEFEAVRWYMEAAEAGEPSAQLALARCLANGTGVPQDEKQVTRGCGPSCGAALLALV
jgi:hypothetical protein